MVVARTGCLPASLLLGSWIGTSVAQQAGTLVIEGGPTIALRECTRAGGCTSRQAKVTLDANWRWIHSANGYVNCFTDGTWSRDLCPDPTTCAQKCAIEGVSEDEYSSNYGITSIPGGVKLGFLTPTQHGNNVGSRLYLLSANGQEYQRFRLKNREFTMDVDSSQLQCGMNGAAYFVEMDTRGGLGRGQNGAGARLGTGYCDAQCPHDIKFINGEANIKDWRQNPKDISHSTGLGRWGACCAEMDIWEANKMATAFTPHPCNINETGQLRCEGTSCGNNDSGERYNGVCDKDGCDINAYRTGNHNFYGPGPEFAVDSSRPITVVTQFLTNNGTDEGDLSEIRRFYVQDGRTVYSPPSTILGPDGGSSITDGFCGQQKTLFGDINDFARQGGLAQMGRSLDRGHVLALSLWDDFEANMLWLDSADPPSRPIEQPGVVRGGCLGGNSSTPSFVRQHFPHAYVTYANVAIGEINSTMGSQSRLVYP